MNNFLTLCSVLSTYYCNVTWGKHFTSLHNIHFEHYFHFPLIFLNILKYTSPMLFNLYLYGWAITTIHSHFEARLKTQVFVTFEVQNCISL